MTQCHDFVRLTIFRRISPNSSCFPDLSSPTEKGVGGAGGKGEEEATPGVWKRSVAARLLDLAGLPGVRAKCLLNVSGEDELAPGASKSSLERLAGLSSNASGPSSSKLSASAS